MPTGIYKRKPVDRDALFDAKINKRGRHVPHMKTRCWEWTGSKLPSGYGTFRGYEGKPVYAHRFALARVKGPSDLDALHRCDNPSCVRPSHLRYGNDVENAADRVNRERQHDQKGEKNAAAVMTERKVRMIRRSKLTQTELAKRYGITQAAVSLIIRRKTWQHVE